MADQPITIIIPDAYVSRAITALVNKYDYDETKLEGETQNQFALRIAKQIMKSELQRVIFKYEDDVSKPTKIELI